MPTLTSVTNHFITGKEGFTTTTSGSVASGATTVGLNSVSGYTNGDSVAFVIDPTDANKKQVFTGTIDTSGVQVTDVVWTEGTNQTHAAGATVVDYTTATHQAALVKGLLVSLDQDGTLKAGAVDNAAALASNVVTTAKIADANVTTAKLAEASVTSEKLNATVAFRGTTVQAIPGPSNGYDITSYTEVYDLGSDFASGVFTAPYNGVYHFDATAGATNLNGRMDCIILKGTTQVARSQVWGNTSASDPMASCSVALSLTAGDTVKMQAGSADSAITLAAPSQFSGFLVGRV